MFSCGHTRDHLQSSHSACFPGRTLDLPKLPDPPLPGLSFPHLNLLPSVSDAGLLSHRLAPNLSPEILTIPKLLWKSLCQMSCSVWLLETSVCQLHMASLVDRHLSLSTGVLKGSWAGRRDEMSPGLPELSMLCHMEGLDHGTSKERSGSSYLEESMYLEL